MRLSAAQKSGLLCSMLATRDFGVGLNVWLLHPGETVPFDSDARPFRYRLLADSLVDAGHSVTQWTSTFNHFTKKQRAHCDTFVSVRPGYSVQLLYGGGYASHASPRRLLFNTRVARAFSRQCETLSKPDVIVTSIPTLELSRATLEYARRHRIPVVVDIRDLWPDVYLKALPTQLRFLGSPLLWPARRLADWICREADGLIAVSQGYLDWGLRHARRDEWPQDRVFHLGHRREGLNASQRELLAAHWQARGLDRTRTLRCCYFGVLGKSSGVDSLVAVARRLWNAGHGDIEFVVCGSGPREEEYRLQSRDVPNVRFVGWVTPGDIALILEWSDVGLAFYNSDATQSLPNKPIEYMSGGLPILSTLPGELQGLLMKHRCGATCDIRNVQAIADILLQWKAEPTLRRSLGANALRLYEDQFTAECIYPEMIAYLGEMTSGPTSQNANAFRQTA